MNTMGLQTIYDGPNTSKKESSTPDLPYMLRKLVITLPDQIW